MIEQNNKWRFYGRENEIEELTKRILKLATVGTSVMGRRRIGKSYLLQETILHLRRLPPNRSKPIMYMLIPDKSANLGEDLRAEIAKAGLNSFMQDFVATPTYPEKYFALQLQHLVQKGVVIALDEFHNIENYAPELPSRIQIIQDENMSLIWGHTGGGLVVAGSHQQNMLRIMGSDREPLYDRFRHPIILRQLSIQPLLAMACDQGWLRDPRQFLTLYSAYGGVPGLWHEYYQEEQLRDNLVCTNYEQWRPRFWRYESLRPLLNQRQSYDYKGLIELTNHARRLLATLIDINPGGTPRTALFSYPEGATKQQKEVYRKTVAKTIKVLENELQMITGVYKLGQLKSNPHKYKLTDNDTRHQLLVGKQKLTFEELMHENDAFIMNKLKITENYEGFDLERMAMEFLQPQLAGGRGTTGARADGQNELDVLIRTLHDINYDTYRDGDPVLHKDIIMASCKRNQDEHKNVEKQFERWLQARYDKRKEPRPDTIRKVVVSPLFSPEGKIKKKLQVWKNKGIEVLDFPAMAKELGYDPDNDPKLAQEHESEPSIKEPGPDALQSKDVQDVQQSPWYEDPFDLTPEPPW